MISILFTTLRGYHYTSSIISLPPPKEYTKQNFETCTVYGNLSSSNEMHKTELRWLLKCYTLPSSRETKLQREATSCSENQKCLALSSVYHTATHRPSLCRKEVSLSQCPRAPSKRPPLTFQIKKTRIILSNSSEINPLKRVYKNSTQ